MNDVLNIYHGRRQKKDSTVNSYPPVATKSNKNMLLSSRCNALNHLELFGCQQKQQQQRPADALLVGGFVLSFREQPLLNRLEDG